MDKRALFLSKGCPEGFILPRAELLSLNLIEGTIAFKTLNFVYVYSFKTSHLTLTNIKTLKKISINIDKATTEDRQEFETQLLDSIGIDVDLDHPLELVKNIKESGICPRQFSILSDMEQIDFLDDEDYTI